MEIKKAYSIQFPLDKVYRGWVASETAIEPAAAMDINPVVGGHYRLIIEMPDFSSANEGKFELVEPEQHIRYSGEWNHDGEVTRHNSGCHNYVVGFIKHLTSN